MRDLESLSLWTANEGFDISSPIDFWTNVDSLWEILVNLLKLSYTKNGPTQEDIARAVENFEEILNFVLKKEGR